MLDSKEQQAPDVTQGLAQANAQREAMAQQQLQNDQDQNTGVVVVSAKGGPIGHFVKGGGIPSLSMMKFADGGGAAASTLLSPNYSGPKPDGGWAGTPYADMAPNQQAWANQQQTLWGQEKANANNPAWSGWSQLSGTPAAIWPTAAPTAPTPLNEPTTAIPPVVPAVTAVNPAAGAAPAPTPVTGLDTPLGTLGSTNNSAVNTASNKNFTGATDYNINSAGQLAATNANPTGAVSSSLLKGVYMETGGPVSEIGAYDYGGSIAGMPPGLPQQQTIPPVYYNPQTYAASGAPVGRGVSVSSLPTYAAASVPTFASGGMVEAEGLDDGGQAGLDPDPGQQAMYETAMYGPGAQDYGQEQDQSEAQPEQVALSTFPHPVHTGIPMPRATTPRVTMPHMPMMRMPMGRGAAPKPQPEHFGNPNENMAPTTQAPVGEAPMALPQGAPPSAPQIEDGYGNPSHGLIDAITDGLHTLGQALGLGGQQNAIPQDTTVSANQQAFTRGEGAMSQNDMNQVYKLFDPADSLNQAMRNMAGMEGVHNQLLLDGNYEKAGQYAASMLMYARKMSALYADAAVDKFQKGDIDAGLAAMKQSFDEIPDARKLHFEKTDNGNIDVAITNMRNVVEWKQTMAPKDVLAYAVKGSTKDGSLFWDALETQAAKYDPEYKAMAEQRKQDASAERTNRGLLELYPPQAGGPPAPQQVQPQITPASTTQNNTGAPNASAPPVQPGQPPGTEIWHQGGTPSGPIEYRPTPHSNLAAPSPDTTGGAQTAIPPPGSAQRPGIQLPSNFGEMTPPERNEFIRLGINRQQQDRTTQQEQFRDLTARRAEAWKERAANMKEKTGRERAANAPMKSEELGQIFNQQNTPIDALSSTPSFTTAMKQDSKAVPQYLDTTFGADGAHALGRAVFNGQAFNSHMQTQDIAETVAGLATNRYMIDPSSAKDISDEYGRRVRFDYGLKGQDGKFQALGTMVLPQTDLNQIGQMQLMYRKANAPAPARQAIPFPGQIRPTATPSGLSTGAPPPPTMPGPQGMVPGSDQLQQLMQ